MQKDYFKKAIVQLLFTGILFEIIYYWKGTPKWIVSIGWIPILFFVCLVLETIVKSTAGTAIYYFNIQIGKSFLLKNIGEEYYKNGAGFPCCKRLYHLYLTDVKKNKFKADLPIYFVSDEIYMDGKYIKEKGKEKFTQI